MRGGNPRETAKAEEVTNIEQSNGPEAGIFADGPTLQEQSDTVPHQHEKRSSPTDQRWQFIAKSVQSIRSRDVLSRDAAKPDVNRSDSACHQQQVPRHNASPPGNGEVIAAREDKRSSQQRPDLRSASFMRIIKAIGNANPEVSA